MHGLILLLVCAVATAVAGSEEFVVGDETIARGSLDTENRMDLLVNADKPTPKNGHCTKFTYYANWTRTIFHSGTVQVFREKFPNGTYEAVYYGTLRPRRVGLNTHTVRDWKEYFNVIKGDLIGIEHMWNDPPLVPYDGRECDAGDKVSTLFFKIPKRGYRHHVFREIPAGSKPCRKYSIQMHCKEGNAYGRLPKDRPKVDNATEAMYVMNANLWWEGKVTSWHLYAKRAGEIYLQVFRGDDSSPDSVRRQYKLIASKKFVLPNSGVHNLKLTSQDQMDVKKGDRLGFYFKQGNPIPYDVALCHTEGTSGAAWPRKGDSEMWTIASPGEVRVGKVYDMQIVTSGVEFPDCRRYSIQGVIKPKSMLP